MKIIVIGAGITGLTASLRLLQKGHDVLILEKESISGGLAGSFREEKWSWSLEKGYHHWFTNDKAALKLAQDLNHTVNILKPKTSVYINNKIIQFDSPKSILSSQILSNIDKLRLGTTIAYLKNVKNYSKFNDISAYEWLRKYMGKNVTELIWDPLLIGKFGQHKDRINMTWFWARIKKRTQKLAYPEGGFAAFTQRLSDEIINLGGTFQYDSQVEFIRNHKNYITVLTKDNKYKADKILVTLPSPKFSNLLPRLSRNYKNILNSVNYLHAQILVLVFKKPFMKDTYWLNILEKNYPFLVLVEHTNFIDSKYYDNKHLLYIGNYLSLNHEFFNMNKKQLLNRFDPYIRSINNNYRANLQSSHLFNLPFAQPVVVNGYDKKIPKMKTPIKNVFLANLDMVYPWDRGTNFAVEMGENVARLIDK